MPRPSLRSDDSSGDPGGAGVTNGVAQGTPTGGPRGAPAATPEIFAAVGKDERLISKPLREMAGPSGTSTADTAPCNVEVEVEKEEPKDMWEHMFLGQGQTEAEKLLEARRQDWDPLRLRLAVMIDSTYYERFIGVVILFNVVIMCIEATNRAQCYPAECPQPTIDLLNRILLCGYTIELLIKAAVWRWEFFDNRWNTMDVGIVGLGWFDEGVSALLTGSGFPGQDLWPILRLLRVARLMRAVHLLKQYPELYVMVRGFIDAMKAMFWGFVMIIVLIVIWGLICIEVINPINKDMIAERRTMLGPDSINLDCEAAFTSIFQVALFLFQILVAGDAWGECINPLVKYQPLTFMIFAAALMTVTLGFMNLILAVVVDRACAARDEDRQQQLRAKAEERLQALDSWKDLMRDLDKDGSGALTYDEFMEGWDIPQVQDAMSMLGLDKMDMHHIFEMVDKDGSGDVDYEEFLNCFVKAEKNDLRVTMMMARLQTEATERHVTRVQGDIKALQKAEQDVAAEIHKLEDDMMLSPTSQVFNTAASSQRNWGKQDPDAYGDVGAESTGAGPFNEEFRALQLRIQEQFEALGRSIEQNTVMFAKSVEAFDPSTELPSMDSAKR